MYGRDALKRLREKQQDASAAAASPDAAVHAWIDVPPDAPVEDPVLTVWNGERFIAYDRWLATAPLVVEEERPAADAPTIPADATCVAGECGGTRIWLVKDGERWLMFVGSRKAGGRRRDFASPFLAHAIRTAEHLYGAAGGGWRAEKGRDGNGPETADLYPQD